MYTCYGELAKSEKEDFDYRISYRDGSSGVLILAPHGGGIEPGTAEIARAVASDVHAVYCFEGLKRKNNFDLHVTSTCYDEPICMRAVSTAGIVLSIHGCKGDETAVYFGGLDTDLAKRIGRALTEAGFTVAKRSDLAGKDPRNICNRNVRGMGVQIEITAGLRRAMFAVLSPEGGKDPNFVFDRFTSAIKDALIEYRNEL